MVARRSGHTLTFLTAIGLSVAILTAGKIYGQDTIIYYTQIKQFDSLTKDKIFDRIKLWSVEAFKKTSGSIQVDDREAGLLAYDASLKTFSPNVPKIKDKKEEWKLMPYYHHYLFKLKVQIKENKYRAEVYDIKLVQGETNYQLTSATKAPYDAMFTKQSKLNSIWADEKFTFEEFSKELFLSLEVAVQKSDDW